MKTKYFLLVAALVSLASCSTARFYSGYSTEVAAAEGVAMLDPVSAVFYLDRNNQESFSDSLSIASEALIEQLAYGLPLDIHARIPLNESQREEAVGFLRYAEGLSGDQLQTYPIPAALDSLIEASGQRYALFLFTEGMTRDRRGYAKQVAAQAAGAIAAGVVSALLGGGAFLYSTGPARAATHIHVAILDSQINRIVYFNRDLRQDQEISPLDAEAVNLQLRRLFKPFLK